MTPAAHGAQRHSRQPDAADGLGSPPAHYRQRPCPAERESRRHTAQLHAADRERHRHLERGRRPRRRCHDCLRDLTVRTGTYLPEAGTNVAEGHRHLLQRITERAAGTIDALFSPRLWTENGLLTQAGDKTFWDRSTLYALRGVYAAGETEKATDYLHRYSATRLLGDHVPYAIEAWPEGNQCHLSAENGLYGRSVTEGLFGIRPTGFHRFTLTPPSATGMGPHDIARHPRLRHPVGHPSRTNLRPTAAPDDKGGRTGGLPTLTPRRADRSNPVVTETQASDRYDSNVK